LSAAAAAADNVAKLRISTVIPVDIKGNFA
jgi:hypothetical protein